MRRLTTSLAAGLALVLAAPAYAQDAAAERAAADGADAGEASGEEFGEAMFSAMMAMFEAPPLSAEQQARLPAARAIIERIIPPGTMGEMMGSIFDGFLGPVKELASLPSSGEAARRLGLEARELDLGDERSGEVLALLDPHWRERQEQEMAAVERAMARMMSVMEPSMRNAMTELYAINFDARELADIGAFFATDSGTAYARKSFTMASDPRMVASMMQAMPQMMGALQEIEAEVESATSGLPPARTYADLDAGQLARLTALTGLTAEQIEQGMARAADTSQGAGDDAYWDGEAGDE